MPGSFNCTSCDGEANMVPGPNNDVCTKCDEGEVASSGICIPAPVPVSGSALSEILQNNVTPFFVMVILSLGCGLLGVLVYYNKSEAPTTLLQRKLLVHGASFFFFSAGFISELILSVSVLWSNDPALLVPGALMLLSRFVVAVFPGLYVVKDICLSTEPAVTSRKTTNIDDAGDESVKSTSSKSMKYYVDAQMVYKNSKMYTVLLVIGCVEPPMLSFLPWWSSPYADVANYPTPGFMKMVVLFKILQLSITFVAQVMLLLLSQKTESTQADDALLALLVINVTLSALSFVVKIVELRLRWGVLSGSNLSVESDAANAAAEGAAPGASEGAVTTVDDIAADGIELGETSSSPIHEGHGHDEFEGANSEHVQLLREVDKRMGKENARILAQVRSLMHDERSKLVERIDSLWAEGAVQQDSIPPPNL
jgi:hypothetical protein